MAADITWKQGDTRPLFTYPLTNADGTAVNLTGATVKLVMRDHQQDDPIKLTGVVTVTGAATGGVQYAPTAADTATPGLYMGNWVVTFADGSTQTFPTSGYLWVEIEQNLTQAGGATLVSLPDLKEYLNIDHSDRSRDSKLLRYVEAVTPVIESMAGPIVPRVYEEWHDGGQYFVRVRRRPSTAYGTSPILDLVACSEFRGPIEFALKVVADPGHGDTYSCMLDARTGEVTRRTAGGGVIAFPPMAKSVHVVYRAGQAKVPANVNEATLELIRVNYQTTQQVGRGRFTVADEQDTGPALGFFVPRRVRELLQPNRRHPSLA